MGYFDDLIPAGGAKPEAPSAPRGIGQPEELTAAERLLSGVTLPAWMDNLRGSSVYRAAKGMANPVVGAAQIVANALPGGAGEAVNRRIAEVQAETDAQTRARGNETGGAVAEFAGEVLSPVNLAIAARVPMAATAGARAAQGAGIGAGTAAMQPVSDGGADFWLEKGKQAALGAAAGGILTPALGKLADRAVRHVRLDPADVTGARASIATDEAIARALAETGQTAADIPADILQGLRQQVLDLAKQGKRLDAAAALRRADFDAVGIEPTLGQVTRDPTRYALEKNLQSIPSVGDELTQRFHGQNARLAELVTKPAAGASDAVTAGERLSASLRGTDETLRRHVSGLYREARAAGDATDIPLQGLAQDYAEILASVPENVRRSLPLGPFESLGLGKGTQQRVFGYDEAEKLLQVINASRSNEPAVQNALGRMREAVKRAIVESGGEGPYGAARRAASERFSLHDAVPALRAAAEGSVAPDDFVRRFVIGGKAGEVRSMADVLRQVDPPAWQEARAQIADTLKRAAFGENPAGDAPFRSQSYMRALRELGPQKLSAFFSPKEMQDMLTVGRVGAYMRSFPADAPVNTSRTAGVGMWMASKVPGVRDVAALAQSAARTVKGARDARTALDAAVPVADADLTPAQVNLLARILGIGAASGGVVAGGAAGR